MFIVIFVFFQEISRNIIKKKLKCGILQFGSLDENGILEVANLSLDKPELEVVFFNDDDQEGRGKT